MNCSDYQKLAARTMKPRRDLATDLSDYVMGLTGEAGELANTVKKMLYHNHEWDTQKILEECGDTAWYLAVIVEVLGADLDSVLNQNIEKLRQRYPDGYSDDYSINRTR